MTRGEALQLLSRIPYFDVHGHGEGLLPLALRILELGRIPKDIRLADVGGTGVRGIIVCALGDESSFGRRNVVEFDSVVAQLEEIGRALHSFGGDAALDAEALARRFEGGEPAFVLGVEGGNFLGEHIERLDAVYALGCRLIGLVHYSKNAIASISFGWGGRRISGREQTGLTAFGRSVIERANDLGMIVDLAHADEPSIRDALDASRAPVLCSHTGPLALQDHPRYLSDEVIRGIAGKGGLVGLWPFRRGRVGIPNLAVFAEYCAHCANVAGAEHIAIGSDVNGIPGYMAGYRGLQDAWKIVAALADKGFSERELEGIIGGNFLAFYKRVDAAQKADVRT